MNPKRLVFSIVTLLETYFLFLSYLRILFKTLTSTKFINILNIATHCDLKRLSMQLVLNRSIYIALKVLFHLFITI